MKSGLVGSGDKRNVLPRLQFAHVAHFIHLDAKLSLYRHVLPSTLRRVLSLLLLSVHRFPKYLPYAPGISTNAGGWVRKATQASSQLKVHLEVEF